MQQNKYQMTQKRHSRIGIASVIIGIILPILLIVFIGGGVFLDTRKNTVGNSIAGGFILSSLTFPLIHLVALIFALVGIFSKQTKKLFPIIGIVLNTILMIAGILLIVLIVTTISIPVR